MVIIGLFLYLSRVVRSCGSVYFTRICRFESAVRQTSGPCRLSDFAPLVYQQYPVNWQCLDVRASQTWGILGSFETHNQGFRNVTLMVPPAEPSVPDLKFQFMLG